MSETAFYICSMKQAFSLQTRHSAKFFLEIPEGRHAMNQAHELPSQSKVSNQVMYVSVP